MNQEDIVKQIHYYSEKASDATQKLAIAGIALVWLFREIIDEKVLLSQALASAIIWFVVSIGINIISYMLMAIVYGVYSAKEGEQEVHETWAIISWILFVGQFLALLIGFVRLFSHLRCTLFS